LRRVELEGTIGASSGSRDCQICGHECNVWSSVRYGLLLSLRLPTPWSMYILYTSDAGVVILTLVIGKP
jgi:hypothetical protein